MELEGEISEDIALYASCTCANDSGIWIMNGMLPIFYFYSFDKKEITSYKVIPGCKNQQIALFNSIFETKDELFFIPNTHKCIVVYNKKEDKFTDIRLENECLNMFRGHMYFNGILYCIPYRSDYIIGIDVKSKRTFIESKWKEANRLENANYINAYTIIDDKIFVVVPETNCIYEYNFSTHRWHVYRIGSSQNSYTYICCLGENFCVFEQNKKELYLVDIYNDMILKQQSIDFKSVYLVNVNSEIVIVDDVESNKWIIIDADLNIIKRNTYKYRKLKRAYASPYYFGCWFKNKNEKLYCIDCYNHLLELDKSGNETLEELNISCDIWNESLKTNNKVNTFDIIIENDIYNLSSFIFDL